MYLKAYSEDVLIFPVIWTYLPSEDSIEDLGTGGVETNW